MAIPLVIVRLTSVVAGFFLASAAATAQDFPSRPIKLIVAANAGGPQDILGRALGEGYRARKGQNFIIENRPGGNFMIGAQACKNAPPDGYTLCMFSIGAISINPWLYTNLGYDPETDLEPVINIGSGRSVLLLHGSVPAKNLKELTAYTQQNPDKLNYASLGIGGGSHLLIEWVKYNIGAKMTHVPYAGAAPALLAFERGELHLVNPLPVPQVQEIIKSGRGRGLLAFGGRIPELPDVPTPPEAGLPPLMFDNWFGLFAPAGTPPKLIDEINRDLVAVIKEPSFNQKYIEGLGFATVANSAAEFKKSLPGYRDHAGELVRLSGIRKSDAAPR
ncbi:MAG TPA: tripartite tricarboxylate transporter substrate binding protein [Xanthobacteraceae bacterium]|nr:tripartite tricarboxylate transporter substrate binding protein [Xanthobacteraceae bacterium]